MAIDPNALNDPIVGIQQEERRRQEKGLGDTIADVALGAPRGVLSAAQGVYSLADTVTGDALPDVELNFLGEAETSAGAISKGVFQFLSGFVPVAGQLGRVGAFAKLGRGAKAARAAAAGAITDFTVFEGSEERLSNFLQEYPALQNPVFEFLAADAADGEIEGRFKATLEGLGLGVGIDALATVLKGIRGSKGINPGDIQKTLGDGLKEGPEAPDIFEPPKFTLDDVVDKPELLNVDELTARVNRRSQQKAAGTEILGQPKKKSAGELLEAELTEEYLNLSKFEDGDLQAFNRGTEDLFVKYFQKNLPNTQPRSLDDIEKAAFHELQDLVDAPIGKTDELFGALTVDIEQDLNYLPKLLGRVHATRLAAQASLDRTREVAQRLASGAGGARDEALLLDYLHQHARLTAGVKGYGAEIGRGLRLFGAPVKAIRDVDLQDLLDQAGGSARTRDLAGKVLRSIDSAGGRGLTQLAERPFQKSIHIANELFINSILSGTRTISVNALSNAATSVYRPLERVLGAGINTLRGVPGARQEVQRAFSTVMGLSKGWSDSLRFAKESFKSNKGILETAANKLETRPALTAQNLGVQPQGVAAGMVDWVANNIVRLPSRVLQGTDEFFKQLNFRSSLWADLTLDGQSKGLSGDELAAHIHDQFDTFIKDGVARSQGETAAVAANKAKAAGITDKAQLEEIGNKAIELSDRGLDTAREATFTQELPKGSLARGVQNLVNQHPMLRMFAPFIRTPANLIGFGAQRSPLGLATQAAQYLRSSRIGNEALENSKLQMLRQMASSDPRTQAEVTGRFAAGLGFLAATTTAFMAGGITGRGPSNPRLRKTMELGGWQPYSIKVGDKWVSYQRLDPLATVLGISADLFGAYQYASDEYEDTMTAATMSFLVATSANLTQKSFLQGIQDLTEVLNDPERFGERFLTDRLALVVPNLVAQTAQAVDPEMREARDFTDKIIKRIPFFSENLDPVRDVLGEPLSAKRQLFGDGAGGVSNFFLPIAVSEVKDDEIRNELSSLGHAFSPPRVTQGGVDLSQILLEGNQSAYDRYSQLAGKVKIRGKTLRAAIKQTIRSAQYQRSQPLSGDLEGLDDPKVDMLQSVVRRYRRVAREQLERESKEVREAYRKVERQRQEAKLGIAPQLLQ